MRPVGDVKEASGEWRGSCTPTGPTMHTNAANRYIRDDAAFQRYLDVVNRTLAEVGDRFPYHAVVGSFASALGGRPLVVSIRGERGDSATSEEIELGCVLDGLTFRVAPIEGAATAMRWSIDRGHIDAVVAEPWRYLADPSRLELPPFSLVGPARPAVPRPRNGRRHVHASRP